MKWPPLLLIDKPKGISSFDVIRRLRKRYAEVYGAKAPKMGHAGTLDPAATGLMLIGVGDGTKALKDYIGLDKVYEAEVLLGERRSTGDMDGEVIEEAIVPDIDIADIETALASMVGTIRLPVSAYSAMKKGGVPMYKRAREAAKIGEFVNVVPWRDMEVRQFQMHDDITKNDDKLIIKVIWSVGSGTYIRSLAEELGARLGVPATLYSLRRTQVGEFDIEDAKRLENM